MSPCRALVVVALVGCGGAQGEPPPSPTTRSAKPLPPTATASSPVEESRYAPLEVGADYLRYRRVTDTAFLSRVHGNRWVHVYVNEVGAEAYLADGAEIPVGTVVVKASWQDDGAGAPSATPGPIYVMEKRAPGYAPEHGDWYFAIHWAEPTPDEREKLGGPIYWRGASPRVEYCYDCHDSYDRGLGGLVPSSVLYR